MSTAGPAWGDTSRTTEASVLLEGAGLIDVGRADNPLIFTDPASLSFHYLNVNHGAVARPLLSTIMDAQRRVSGPGRSSSGPSRRRPAR